MANETTFETETRAFYFTDSDDETETEEPESFDIYASGTTENRYGEKAILEGKTYEAFVSRREEMDAVLPWAEAHQTYDRYGVAEWIVDADDLDLVETALDELGYTFADLRDAEDDSDDTETDAFDELLAAAGEGDRIEVVYAKKNKNGSAERTGVVDVSRPPSECDLDDPYAPDPLLVFVDDEGKFKRLDRDDRGRPSIYSSGYYPYMGRIELVRIERMEADSPAELEAEALGF